MSQLIFTKDFRQQVRGKLKAGSKCIISYDPLRLIPLTKDYLHGDPNNPITVHIKFSASEVQLDLLLYSKIGVTNAPVIRNDGLGSMLIQQMIIPGQITEMAIWFSLKNKSGQVVYDSNYGKNYHFRFPGADVKIIEAKLENNSEKPNGELEFKVDAAKEIDSVTINFAQTNRQKISGKLQMTNTKNGDRNEWDSGIVKVPFGAVISYEIAYKVAGKEFKLNNNGRYLIIDSTT